MLQAISSVQPVQAAGSSATTSKSSPAVQTHADAETTPVTSQNSTSTKQNSKATPAADTVTISSQAQLALKELHETPAQTQKEALAGDRQAQRLLAKEQAAEKAAQG